MSMSMSTSMPIDGGKGLLMEKADRGSLGAALRNRNRNKNINKLENTDTDTDKLSLEQLVSISTDIVDGLDFIHSKLMVHRDLKPENVLLFDVKSQLTAKIADFGTSKVVQMSLAGTAMVGTPYYMAPELFIAQARYGWEVDVYSVSIVLYEVFSGRNIQDAYAGIENTTQLALCAASGRRPEIPKSFPAELRTVVERGWSADANVRPTLVEIREALRKLKPSTRNANATASASTSRRTTVSTRGDANVYTAFEAQLLKLESSTKTYKLVDARRQVGACRRLLMRLDDANSTKATATSATARFHSVKGYVHHWFGECSDAYKETYQALTEMYELCLLGTSVVGEQVVTILRYAFEVCWSQDQFAAAFVLVRYALRYAKSKLSAAAYADALESLLYNSADCNAYFWNPYYIKIAEFVLATRLEASVSANKPHINVAIAHYYLAKVKYWDYLAAHMEKAQHVINQVDANNIWAAVCKSLKGFIIYLNASDEAGYEKAKQCLEDALGIAERILGSSKTVVEIYYRLAETLKEMKRFGEAEDMFKKAIEAAENSLDPNCWLVGRTVEDLANMFRLKLQKYEEAEKLYLRSVEIYKSLFGPGHWRLSYLYGCLADIYTKWGQTEKAATYSQLQSVVESGKLEDKFKSAREAMKKLAEEVSRTLDSGSKLSVAPGELVDVLHNFFEVAPNPQPL